MIEIADILLVAGAVGAGLYCLVLSRRLRRFTDLESGVGGAVAVLSAQVDDLSQMLAAARQTAARSVDGLDEASERAEAAGRRIELLLASLHDLPETASGGPEPAKRDQPFFVRHPEAMGRRA